MAAFFSVVSPSFLAVVRLAEALPNGPIAPIADSTCTRDADRSAIVVTAVERLVTTWAALLVAVADRAPNRSASRRARSAAFWAASACWFARVVKSWEAAELHD